MKYYDEPSVPKAIVGVVINENFGNSLESI